jgi:hypothetical protein
MAHGSSGAAALQNRHVARRRQEEGDDAALGRAVSYTALLCLLRGRAYAGLDNRARAIAWYTAALRADPFCHEAFQARAPHLRLIPTLTGARAAELVT